jgi:hypothetical protein
MTATRRKLGRRDANEPEIIAALRKAHCSVVQLDHPCDLLVGRAGVNVLMEIKDPDKKPSERRLTETEVEFHGTWRGQVCVVETVEDAYRAIGIE